MAVDAAIDVAADALVLFEVGLHDIRAESIDQGEAGGTFVLLVAVDTVLDGASDALVFGLVGQEGLSVRARALSAGSLFHAIITTGDLALHA